MMDTNINISIITASYNYAEYISETIESVINQTYPNWELIIVDDGSKDNSVEIIKSYCNKDDRIKLFQHKNGKNKGLKQTLLLGIKKASADWIAFLEADDTLENKYLEEKLKIINDNSKLQFIFNNFNLIGDSISEKEKYNDFFQKEMANRSGISDYKEAFYTRNPVPTFSVAMIKKELLERLDFSSPIKACLDRYLWSQVAAQSEFYYIPQKLTNWRQHNNSYYRISKKKITYLQRLFYYIKISSYLPGILQEKIQKMRLLLKIL